MRIFFLTIVLVLSACGDSAQEDDNGNPGASERDTCDAVAQCIFGAADEDGDLFADQCVTDGIFSEGSAACRGCLVDLSCANLEAAFEGDADAQAMCPACE